MYLFLAGGDNETQKKRLTVGRLTAFFVTICHQHGNNVWSHFFTLTAANFPHGPSLDCASCNGTAPNLTPQAITCREMTVQCHAVPPPSSPQRHDSNGPDALWSLTSLGISRHRNACPAAAGKVSQSNLIRRAAEGV